MTKFRNSFNMLLVFEITSFRNIKNCVPKSKFEYFIQSNKRMFSSEHTSQLNTHSFLWYFVPESFMNFCVLQWAIDKLVNRKVESSLESETSENSQRIVFEGNQGVKRSSDDLVMNVRDSLFSPIFYFGRINVVEKSIDGEVSPESICKRCSHFLNDRIYTICGILES